MHNIKHTQLMAAAMKSSIPLAILIIMLVAQTHLVSQTQAQNTCVSSLSNLNVCTPFVVPGATASPSSECCGALQGVDHDCLCSTLRIAARMPAQCNLAPLTCGN